MTKVDGSAVGLRLYNSLTRQKSPFEPIDRANVRLYVCGPTVYDYAHIGNARPVIVFDVLFRLLRHLYGADHVTYVRNITDVEDKINARARRDHPDLPLNEAIRAVTERTARQFQADANALGCLEPTHQPRATEHIDGMIAMIQTLIEKGHAYVAQGEVGREALFDVLSMPSYGALSNRRIEEQQAGARVAVEPHKRNPGDFVLWKESGVNEPGWDATFTISDENKDELHLNSNEITIHGRPGWHIECSVMSDALLWHAAKESLGDEGLEKPHEFDIHGGGIDLVFPHHENEIAQSRCAHGTERMANVWMHNGFLQVEGQKMSKSLGNFFTVHELLETDTFGGRKWPGEVLRLAMLMTHYREPIDFSVRRLEEAEAKIRRWGKASYPQDAFLDGVPTAAFELQKEQVGPLLDDLNTPAFISEIDALAASARAGDDHAKLNLSLALKLIGLEDVRSDAVLSEPALSFTEAEMKAVQTRISKRLALIADKNWAEADRIRDELLAQGIQLKDSKDSETGERVTTWEVIR